MNVPARQGLLAFLVGAFFFQTWLVYSDPAGRDVPLSAQAQEGRRIWNRHNCQSCHQVYGFGGFLGPDLTNSAPRLSPERLESVLTDGAGQMPAFGLSSREREAVASFLEELDKTGVGQARLGEVVSPEVLAAQVVERLAGAEGSELSEAAARGRDVVVAQGCITCHLPNRESLHRAPDLTTLTQVRDEASILGVLREGIPGTAMPRLSLAAEDGEAVLAFLAWMEAHGDEIRAAFESLSGGRELDLGRVPWFEYE